HSLCYVNCEMCSELAENLALLFDVHGVGCWFFRKTRHGHHGTGQCDDESGAGSYIELANGHAEIIWGTEGYRVVSKRVLSFRHTYRAFVFAGVFELLELLCSRRAEVHAFTAIDIGTDMLDALTNAGIGSEHGLNGVVALVEYSAKFRSKRFGTFAAVGPDADHFGLNTASFTEVFDPLQFFFGVLWELVDRYDDGRTKG